MKQFVVNGGYIDRQMYQVIVEAKDEKEAIEKANKIDLAEWDDMQSQECQGFEITDCYEH